MHDLARIIGTLRHLRAEQALVRQLRRGLLRGRREQLPAEVLAAIGVLDEVAESIAAGTEIAQHAIRDGIDATFGGTPA